MLITPVRGLLSPPPMPPPPPPPRSISHGVDWGEKWEPKYFQFDGSHCCHVNALEWNALSGRAARKNKRRHQIAAALSAVQMRAITLACKLTPPHPIDNPPPAPPHPPASPVIVKTPHQLRPPLRSPSGPLSGSSLPLQLLTTEFETDRSC